MLKTASTGPCKYISVRIASSPPITQCTSVAVIMYKAWHMTCNINQACKQTFANNLKPHCFLRHCTIHVISLRWNQATLLLNSDIVIQVYEMLRKQYGYTAKTCFGLTYCRYNHMIAKVNWIQNQQTRCFTIVSVIIEGIVIPRSARGFTFWGSVIRGTRSETFGCMVITWPDLVRVAAL